MGVHILVYKVKNIKEHDWEDVEKEIGWDSLRHSGDADFVGCDLFYSICCGNPHCNDCFMSRPRDFEEMRRWVRFNIVECSQKRLLDLLDVMEKREDLYLFFSW